MAQKAIKAGYTRVQVLKGGWREWYKSGYPVEKK
ncbi:MAG: hypothetical protein JRJ68_01270 [Deltaproteobacteria bacterium]|nr:hypothetical protein [Deltaproteobacteria bacterium]